MNNGRPRLAARLDLRCIKYLHQNRDSWKSFLLVVRTKLEAIGRLPLLLPKAAISYSYCLFNVCISSWPGTLPEAKVAL